MRPVGESLSRLVTVGFVAATMLVAVAGTAQASQPANFEVQTASAAGLVGLGTIDGYQIGLYMPTERVAILYVSQSRVTRKGKGSLFSYAYAVPNRRSLAHGVIRARFGSLGSLSLRFHPNGHVRKDDPQQGCVGRPALTESGRFVGHASFHGEGGYLHFALSRAAGQIIRSSRLRCKRGLALDLAHRSLRAYVAPGSFFATRGDIALLYASSHDHGRYIGITAGHEAESPPGGVVRIGILESRREMAIGRYALALAPPGTLLTSLPGVHPATATLAPPVPFFGEGSYLEDGPGGSPSWAGTLGVNLPGFKLPLTGSHFHVRLCVLSAFKVRDGCDFFKAEPPVVERLARPGSTAK
jgi:hypothetical protein